VSHIEAFVRMLAGQPERAEQVLRAGLERLDSTDERTLHATTNAMLAQAVYDQGRPAEASALCDAAAADAPPDDIVTQVIWRSVKAKVLAREGRMEAAEVLAREAVALIEPTDLLCHHGDAMLDLAEVLERGSRTDEADKAIRTALALYEKKGNVVAATRARARLAGG
jgi:ATP/maltotriose-dependent transcriptional regulator MalT